MKISNFKCRGPNTNKAPFGPVFAPFTELWNGCIYRDFENRTRCLYGTKTTAPPHPEIRAPAPGVVFLGGTRGWFMKNTIVRYGDIILTYDITLPLSVVQVPYNRAARLRSVPVVIRNAQCCTGTTVPGAVG